MGEPLPVKLYETLANFLNMYTYPDEEVLVLEAVANGIDAAKKAKKSGVTINISFFKEGKNHYVEFKNDAPGMDAATFQNYHTVSFSTKRKGQGIGFAGVGAKIYLASWDGAEILTISSNGKKVVASRMYRRGNEVEYESSLKMDIKKITGSKGIGSFTGTVYKVKLPSESYDRLRRDIGHVLQYWFDLALMTGELKVKVDGTRIKPTRELSTYETRNIRVGGNIVKLYILVSNAVVPEDQRHIVYSVYGKRIKNEPVEYSYQIVDNKSTQISCAADVSILAEYLNSNKEDFDKDKMVARVRNKVREELRAYLTANNLIREDKYSPEPSSIAANELTKRLDKLLQSKKFKFLNPWSKSRIRLVIRLDENGEIVVSQDPEGQSVTGDESDTGGRGGGKGGGGTGGSGGGGGGGTHEDTVGDEEEKDGIVRDEDGNDLGREDKEKAAGINILEKPFTEDDREGWIDTKNRLIVYNTGHPFTKNFQTPSLHQYNLTRVAISVLIKDASTRMEMDAKAGIELFEQMLRDSWD